MNGAPDHEKRAVVAIRLVLTRMKEGKTARKSSRIERLSGLDARDQFFRIEDPPGVLCEFDHFANRGGAGFR